jgi:hypothetical protein
MINPYGMVPPLDERINRIELQLKALSIAISSLEKDRKTKTNREAIAALNLDPAAETLILKLLDEK